VAGNAHRLACRERSHPQPRAPTKAGARTRDSVTALYERVYRTGPDVAADEFARGQVVCFSPSYSATRLTRTAGSTTKHFHLVDSHEVYFSVE
jgi:hypothetical protein